MLSLATLLAAQTVKSIEGQWAGRLQNSSGDSLPLTIRIARSAAGELTGTLDSTKDGLFGLPLDGLNLTGNAVTFRVPAARATFTGGSTTTAA